MSFWLATSFSMTASNLIQFVLSLYVLDQTGSATIFASMLSIIVFPRIFLTPLAGVQGDRIRRLKMMKIVMLFSIFFMLLFSIWTTFFGKLTLLGIYVLVVLLEISEVFYQAAEYAIIPEIVPGELLSEAVSLSKVDDGVVYVASPAIGTVMYHFFGVQGGLWITVILFGLSFLLNFCISTPYYKMTEKIEKQSFMTDFKDGVYVIQKNPFLKHFILIAPLFNFFFSSVYAVTIAHTFLVSLNIGETAYGAYRSITASMVIFVPLFVMSIVKKVETKYLVTTSSLIVSIVLLLTGMVISSAYIFGMQMKMFILIAITILDCFVIAVMMPVQMSTSLFYQKTIPDEFRSRVMSVSRMLSLASIPLGHMVFGILTDTFVPYINVFISACGTFLCYLLYRKAFRYLS